MVCPCSSGELWCWTSDWNWDIVKFRIGPHNCVLFRTPVAILPITNGTEMGIPDHLTCLLRNLYAGQETTARTGHRTMNCFQIWKGECQGSIVSPCLFNLIAENIMGNAGLDKLQAGSKIGGRNINNLRYADNTTLMAESEEELKSLLMKVKEETKTLA